MRPGTPEYFWSRVHIRGADDCWPFEKPTVGNGYGQLDYQGQRWRAHRLAYRLSVGEIPAGMHVCHACDNPLCCNPRHLWLGTDADNQRDRVRKGRQGGKTKLTPRDVAAIKAEREATGASCGYLAEKYGLESSTVVRILNGESWSPIEADPRAIDVRAEPSRPPRYMAVGGACRASMLETLSSRSCGMTLQEIRMAFEEAGLEYGFSTVYSAARSLFEDGLVDRTQEGSHRRAPHVYRIQGRP